MQTVTVKNIMLQFDTDEEPTDEHVSSVIRYINDCLAQRFLAWQPAIMKKGKLRILSRPI